MREAASVPLPQPARWFRSQKLKDHQTGRDDRQHDGEPNDLSARVARDRFVRSDFRFTLDSFRRDLEGP